MSAGDTQLPPPVGPVEAMVLAEMARAEGGLTVETAPASVAVATAGGGGLRILRGGRGTPGADTLVLLHGRGHAAPIWFPCWSALGARHRLVAIDLPGFGASPAPSAAARPAGTGAQADAGTHTGAERGLCFFADPVESVLTAEVRAGHDGSSGLALVGHSLGGLVALELALRRRLPIRRLVLIDGMGLGPAMTFAGRLFFRLHPERLARGLGARLFGRVNPSPPTPLGRRVAALEHELLTARKAAGSSAPSSSLSSARVAAARAFDRLCPLFGPVFHRCHRLSEVTMPSLLLWGEGDAALPLANALGARARMPSATLLTFPVGHSPHLDAPEAVLPPLLHFLAGDTVGG